MGSQVSDICIDCLGKEDEFNDIRSKHIKQIYFENESFEEPQIDIKLSQNRFNNLNHNNHNHNDNNDMADKESLKLMESARLIHKFLPTHRHHPIKSCSIIYIVMTIIHSNDKLVHHNNLVSK